MAATVTISSGATWQEVAADRQKHRDATLSLLDPPLPTIDILPLNTIPLARKYLTAEELKITETLPENLVSQLAKGELSSVAVTKAFLRRAVLAQLAVRYALSIFSLPFPSTVYLSPTPMNNNLFADKLHYRTPPTTRPRPRRLPRCPPRNTQTAPRAPPRPPN
jgi:hypothetical protein